jgi:dihydrofolate reductase
LTAVPVALVLARADNGVIGRKGRLPWRIPRDLQRFRAITMGKPIVMGRKTHQSIGRVLDGRANVIVSADPAFEAPGAHVARSLDQGLALARRLASARGADEVCVVGGAAVYAAALGEAVRIYLTEVHMAAEGEVRLPGFPGPGWREVSRQDLAADGGDSADFSFVVLERESPTP